MAHKKLKVVHNVHWGFWGNDHPEMRQVGTLKGYSLCGRHVTRYGYEIGTLLDAVVTCKFCLRILERSKNAERDGNDD